MMSSAVEDNRETVLDDLPISKLRQYAKLQRVAIANTDSKEMIIEKIRAATKKFDVPKIKEAGERPEPGWARIMLHRDNNPKASNLPVVMDINGYKIGIPRGVEVDVPIKVVDHLRNLVEERAVPHPEDPNMFVMQKFHSFPFNVMDVNPGPDPRESEFQKQKARLHAPKAEFKRLFGYWPTKEMLMEAIKEGFIKLTPDDPTYLQAKATDLKAMRQARRDEE